MISLVSFILMVICLVMLSRKNMGDKRVVYLSKEDLFELDERNLEETKRDFFIL